MSPSSYDDAILMLNRVCDTLDEVLLMAADAGDDDDYLNLLQTRDALVNAYSQKGAVLSSLTQLLCPHRCRRWCWPTACIRTVLGVMNWFSLSDRAIRHSCPPNLKR